MNQPTMRMIQRRKELLGRRGLKKTSPSKGMYGILQCAPTIVPSNTGFIMVAITGKLLGKIRIGRCYIAKID